jgi:heat shock protein HslJ
MRKSVCKLALLAIVAAPVCGLQAQPPNDAGASSPTPPRRAADAALVRALQDHRWTLQSATDADGKPVDALLVPNHAFVMRFEGRRLGVQGGCNQLSGGWRLSPQNQLMVDRLAATMKACEPPLMEADKAMSALLAQPLQASFEKGDAPTLRLVSPERQTLSFAGKRTPQSLYGAPKRIFLEVAPQRVACTPSPRPPSTCLQVRELRFDEKGLRVGEPGPWRTFYGDIEGYTHEPGVRNVLRINRYKRPKPPADGSRYLYVLDLVVESEIVATK